MDATPQYAPMAYAPPLSLAFVILRALCDSIQSAQWNESQFNALETLAAQILHTLDAELRVGHIKEPHISRKLGTLQTLIKRINFFVQSEQQIGFLKLLFTKDDRIAEIEDYHHQLCACAIALQLSPLIDIRDWQSRNQEARQADQQIMDDFLTELEANPLRLVEVLEVRQTNILAVMTALQKAIIRRLGNERERRFFASTLSYLAEVSRQYVTEVESWMVTSYDVEFEREIGPGGFGRVYESFWNQSRVAIKVLKTDDGATPSLALIRRELATWSSLSHPHILSFLGANVFDDRPFIVMPFFKNGNARDFVNDHPDCNQTAILYHISLGLLYLHEHNIVHGDLKASNVLIDDTGCAVLCDFGLSRIKSDTIARQEVPSFLGSRNWMSPERMIGGPLKKPVDIYAFGMTIFEVLTGQIPLDHVEYEDFPYLIVDLDIRPERPEDDLPFRVSDGLWSLAEVCWTKVAQDRPSALAICDEISVILTYPYTNGPVSPSSTASSTFIQGEAITYISDSSHTYIPASPVASSYALPSPKSCEFSVNKHPNRDDVEEVAIDDIRPSKTQARVPRSRVDDCLPCESADSGECDYPLYGTFPEPSTSNIQGLSENDIQRDIIKTSCVQSIVTESLVDSTRSPADDKYSVGEIPDLVLCTSGLTVSPSQHSLDAASDCRRKHSFTRDLPNLKIYPWPQNTRQISETFLPLGERSPEKRPGLNRMTLWFKKRPSPTSRHSGRSPDRDVSGLRINPAHSPLSPRSQWRMSDMWSVDDLIDRWMHRSDYIKKDEEFQDVFLMTYTAFTTCAKVFQILRRRFDATGDSNLPAQVRAFKRHSIISAIIYWIGSPYTPLDPDVLSQMKVFADSVNSSSFLCDKAKGILEAIEQKKEDYPLPSQSAYSESSRALLDNTPQELAVALNVLQGIMYSRIRPADYIGHVKQVQAPNRVAAAAMTTRKITFWVQQKILRSDQVKTRWKAFKFFLKTAQICYEMRNFSAVAAIVAALESDVISCLSETREELVADEQKLLAKLSKFVDSEEEYHAAVSSEELCVPRLEYHLRDLKPVLPTCLPGIRTRDADPISFVGCKALAEALRQVARFTISPLKVVSDSEGLLYLMKQLDVVQVDARAQDELRRRSRQVKAQETSFRRTRTKALEVTGFL